LLNIDGALDGLYHTGKLGQEPIAHQLHNAATALSDPWLHQLPTERLQALERSRLILAHEARIAGHVGGKNGGKSAFQALSPSPRRLTATGGRSMPLGWRSNDGLWPRLSKKSAVERHSGVRL